MKLFEYPRIFSSIDHFPLPTTLSLTTNSNWRFRRSTDAIICHPNWYPFCKINVTLINFIPGFRCVEGVRLARARAWRAEACPTAAARATRARGYGGASASRPPARGRCATSEVLAGHAQGARAHHEDTPHQAVLQLQGNKVLYDYNLN